MGKNQRKGKIKKARKGGEETRNPKTHWKTGKKELSFYKGGGGIGRVLKDLPSCSNSKGGHCGIRGEPESGERQKKKEGRERRRKDNRKSAEIKFSLSGKFGARKEKGKRKETRAIPKSVVGKKRGRGGKGS